MAAKQDEHRPQKTINSLSTTVVALLSILMGVGLLIVGAQNDWFEHVRWLQTVVNGLAGLLVVSFGLGVLWQLTGKRSFAKEILETATAVTDVEAAGITRVGMNYREVPDWGTLFEDVTKLDIFLSYGRTWRNLNLERLKATALRPGTRIRVYLPDVNDETTVAHLAGRFGMSNVDLIAAINEAVAAYEQLATGPGSTVQVFARCGGHHFSAYRFDNTAVITLYSHQRARVEVPTFVCRDGGFLYNFLRDEFKALEEQSTLLNAPATG